jgi:hypothetical protein
MVPEADVFALADRISKIVHLLSTTAAGRDAHVAAGVDGANAMLGCIRRL